MTTQDNRISHAEMLRRLSSDTLAAIDTMVAYTMDEHVIDAYTYLVKYYRDGDRIYLFGFSRGAFTARIIAGMLESVGLLNKGLEVMAATAWQIHKNWEFDGQPSFDRCNKESNRVASEFKRVFSRGDVMIEFLGLWDSVNSIGLLRDRMFPFTAKSNVVKHIRHAVSLDERRGKFKQNLFTPNSYYPSLFSLNCYFDFTGSSEETLVHSESNEEQEPLNGNVDATQDPSLLLTPSTSGESKTDLLEAWFPGAHGDIGGGYSDDLNGQNLANLPFRWVLASAIEFGIILKENALLEYCSKYTPRDSLMSCHHDPLCIFRNHPMNHPSLSRRHILNRENESDLFPKLPTPSMNPNSEIHPIEKGNDCRGDDPLWKPIIWTIGELLPLGIFIEDSKGRWRSIYVPNLGRSRKLPKTCYKLHWSIFWRMHFVKDYKPRNLPDKVKILWDLLNTRNEVSPPDDIGDGKSIVIIKNEDLVDYKTGMLRLDIVDEYPHESIWFNVNWNEVPDDLMICLSKLSPTTDTTSTTTDSS